MAEDGREYYAQSVEFDPARASNWVKENVLEHLATCDLMDWRATPFGEKTYHESLLGMRWWENHVDCPWRSRKAIRDEILSFMDTRKYGNPELWGYYSAYDHIAFCQLFGTMMDLPQGFPMYTRDLKQWADQSGAPILQQPAEGEHHALSDARYHQQIYQYLVRYSQAGMRETAIRTFPQ